MTSMMQQYLDIKQQYKDFILFYRLGDFYEMFFDDAIRASRELELTLTGRDCGEPERAPMCGVPYHSVEAYIGKLISKGYKVAICEQMEDPSTAKGLVKREVVREFRVINRWHLSIQSVYPRWRIRIYRNCKHNSSNRFTGHDGARRH